MSPGLVWGAPASRRKQERHPGGGRHGHAPWPLGLLGSGGGTSCRSGASSAGVWLSLLFAALNGVHQRLIVRSWLGPVLGGASVVRRQSLGLHVEAREPPRQLPTHGRRLVPAGELTLGQASSPFSPHPVLAEGNGQSFGDPLGTSPFLISAQRQKTHNNWAGSLGETLTATKQLTNCLPRLKAPASGEMSPGTRPPRWLREPLAYGLN